MTGDWSLSMLISTGTVWIMTYLLEAMSWAAMRTLGYTGVPRHSVGNRAVRVDVRESRFREGLYALLRILSGSLGPDTPISPLLYFSDVAQCTDSSVPRETLRHFRPDRSPHPMTGPHSLSSLFSG